MALDSDSPKYFLDTVLPKVGSVLEALFEEGKKKTKSSPGEGAVAMLTKLYEEGFFEKAKTIGDLVEHCDVNFAKKFKANEFSGRLARMVREGKLKRTKNAEGQYEYTKE